VVSIVLDTNVLVAALLQPSGSNARVLRTIVSNLDTFKVCFSSAILAEYKDVIGRPLITARGVSSEAEALLNIIIDIGEEVIPKPVYALVYPDRKDRAFLEAAVFVSGVLITNNLKDLPFLGVTVLGVEEFLEWIENR
jgi:putative PIN family toxin of toxin-antitoxin system